MQSPVVLYEDNHLLAVVKSAGDLVQGDATGDTTLSDQCKAYIKEKYQKPGNVFLGIVHRLDRPVSGVVAFARTSKAASRLSKQFRERTTEKIYLALVEGVPETDEQHLVNFLTGGKNRTKVSVAAEERSGTKKAELAFEVLGSHDNRSLLRVKLITGYKHQIRVQLAFAGYPVVGDFKYDHRQTPAEPMQLHGGRAIALHAWRLSFAHPTSKERIHLEAPLPAYWPCTASKEWLEE